VAKIKGFTVTYILSCTVHKLLQIIGQICTLVRGYLSLTHLFGVNHCAHNHEIWPQETRNYGAKCILMS